MNAFLLPNSKVFPANKEGNSVAAAKGKKVKQDFRSDNGYRGVICKLFTRSFRQILEFLLADM